MGRPKRYHRPKVPKVPVVGGKALPGRPRKDGLPPVQRAIFLTPEDKALLANKAMMARIRYFAGLGLPPKLVAVKMRQEYPACKATTEDFEPQGRFYEEAMVGKADAVIEVAAGMLERAKNAAGKGIDPLFWLKCNADWNETAVGRQKAKAADEDDTVVGIDMTVTE